MTDFTKSNIQAGTSLPRVIPVEYPDAAGYPDGMGTLDEGTAVPLVSDARADDVVADLDEFLGADERDS